MSEHIDKVSSILTDRQKKELNQSILDYLLTNKYLDTYESFKRESGVEDDVKQKGMLEKKWISIVRMHRKITELESKIELYEAERSKSIRGSASSETNTLPKAPPLHILKGHRDSVNSVCFHPEYDFVCSASEDASIRVWEFDQGRIEKQFKGHTNSVRYISFNDKGTLLASCSSDLTIKLWDFDSSTCIKTLHGHDHTVSCVKFVPGGDHLVSCSRDKTIKIWETNTGYCRHTLTGHDKWVRSIDISEDGSLLVSGGDDHSVIIWDLKLYKKLNTFSEHENVVESVKFVPSRTSSTITKGLIIKQSRLNGHVTPNKKSSNEKENDETSDKSQIKYAASCGRDKVIYIYDIENGTTVMKLIGHDNWVRDFVFHPDGVHLISVSDDRSIKVWDLKEQKCVKTIADAHDHFVQCIDFCEKNPHLVTGGVDYSVNIWNCR